MEKTSVQNLVKIGYYPQWVLEMAQFLKKTQILFIIEGDGESTRFNILHVPEKLKQIVFEKAKSLGLLFRIHKKQTVIYKGNPITNPKREVAGIQDNATSFEIRKPTEYENIDEICYTLERKY